MPLFLVLRRDGGRVSLNSPCLKVSRKDLGWARIDLLDSDSCPKGSREYHIDDVSLSFKLSYFIKSLLFLSL